MQSLIALLLLSTASGCATYDMDRSRPVTMKSRPYAPRPTYYQVQPGDTLSSIARNFGVPAESIAGANNLYDRDMLRPGQRIVVPKASGRTRYAIQTPVVRRAERPPVQRSPAQIQESRNFDGAAEEIDPRLEGARYYVFEGPRAKPGDMREAVAFEPEREALDLDAPFDPVASPRRGASISKVAGNFIWPVRGKVISAFGGNDETGQRNDGINIAAEAGSPVKAAEAGTVLYAGNELTSYGYLLLIRHPSGYVTAYAHNKELLVKRNQKVKRGQQIAYVGSSGDVDRPQLHFEIRKGDKPVDPGAYLTTATASR
ncbi:MAG: M23 family metallopeptidase [Micropepsaceae bacterium]